MRAARVAAVSGLLVWSSCAPAAGPPDGARNIKTLTILHTNDVHAHLLPDERVAEAGPRSQP